MEGVPAAPTHPTAATNESFIFHISCHTPGNGERRRDKNVATARGQPQGDNAAAPAALPALSFSPPTFHPVCSAPTAADRPDPCVALSSESSSLSSEALSSAWAQLKAHQVSVEHT